MFGATLPLGTTISEIQVTATYRYQIKISGEWSLSADGNRLLVVAPPVIPSLPVAFDTGTVQKKSKAGWARWDSQENLEELEKEITGKLALRAIDPLSISKVRDQGRLAVAKFVKHWLESYRAWDINQFEEIVIAFYGENLTGQSMNSLPSTLRINKSGQMFLP